MRARLIRAVIVASSIAIISGAAQTIASTRWARIHTNDWTPRDGAGLLDLGGYAYLLGGWAHGPMTNEVWRSRHFEDWERLPDAPWAPRHGAGWTVFHDRLWVISGDYQDDVWSSADGREWQLETAHAPFGARYTPNVAVLNDSLLVFGGQWWDGNDLIPETDSAVWRSYDGRAWEKIADAPWMGRGLIHGTAVHDGTLYLIGGGLKAAIDEHAETFAEFSAIWATTDGVTWEPRGVIPFPARTHFSVVGTPVGCFVSDGSVGRQTDLSNDLFVAEDCVHYTQVAVPADFPPRHASSLLWADGYLFIIAGKYAGTDVWRYRP